MAPSYPIPVRACEFCYEVHHKSQDGFHSLELDSWFCSTQCYYQAQLSSGALSMKHNPGLVHELISMRNKHFQPEKIKHKRDKLIYNVRTGKYKVVKRVHDSVENETSVKT